MAAMRWVKAQARKMLELADKLAPEGEGVDFDDLDLTLDELVALRSYLSRMRKNIDVVNSGLARYWDKRYPGEQFEDQYFIWSVGQTKVRRPVDDDMLLEWVSTLDAEKLAKVVNPNRLTGILKVSGMTPAERDTHISEEYSPTSGISINYKEKK